MTLVTPLVICGGTGTRLWPVSRSQSPKQFQRVAGAGSLTFFQSALQRHRGPLYTEPAVVTGAQHRATVLRQAAELQADARVICEPFGRNTGPAVLAAATLIARDTPDAVLLVVPADHVIEGPLTEAVAACVPAAQAGRIVTFGIAPRYPEPGFGYILENGPLAGHDGLYRVGGFVEKPPAPQAAGLIDTGRAYWASGLSMFTARTIIDEYRRHDPDTADAVAQAVAEGAQVPGTYYLSDAPFARADAKPTESAVFERTDRIAMAPLPVSWDDVGSWRAMHAISDKDRDGNVLQGDVVALDTVNTMVRSEDRLVGVVGLENVVVIDTPDALLVARMDCTQSVSGLVEQLRRAGRVEAHRREDAAAPAPAARARPARGGILDTARLAPGAVLTLQPDDLDRHVIVVSGSVEVSGPDGRRRAGAGDLVMPVAAGPVSVENAGHDAADLLVMTRADAAPHTATEPSGAPGPIPTPRAGHG